jgi:hypothetical protein
MAHKPVDPGTLEGDELEAWYRRTPDELEEERRLSADQTYNEFFADGRWQEARAPQPVPPAPLRAEVVGGALRPAQTAPGGGPGSFFGTYPPIPNPRLGPGYITPLPPPLNSVEPSGLLPSRFTLSDGTTVTATEVERIYAEQARTMAGDDEEKVAARVRHVDRVPVGKIPDASTMEEDDREDDPSCHPYGGWEREQKDPARSQRSRDYEAQISRAPGLNYVVRKPDGTVVAFDGCAVWDRRRQLLEAKGPRYAALAAFMEDDPKYPRFNEQPGRQARLQERAAGTRPVDWHIAEKGALPFFEKRVKVAPNFNVYHTPPEANWRLF